ncbi:5'-nucleotidase, lipoprotein e(P4) family [Mangrovibacter plantisponsor]|uniref:5'-nucleotidase (Lipoprotein e(P4) family) n=1 Tax=Mangrovibacter plantisponsor TaxID=451513 RepID=A0A317Q6Q4_9ENTR|nr:5'-nucleotidase, lipoprotein e(P4) family [Mangrovibacter plantisponsor]PWW11725.1 5'-nucleotidase (lipoprotein e(P4) family) [Mangrovibacter plantisponsor]
MKKPILQGIGAAIILALAGCAAPQQGAQQQSTQSQQAIQQTAQQQLAGQSVLAVNWFQQSGEYQALAWQAFNSARLAFDASAHKVHGRRAVIVDLDETMLDNSAYSAWQAKHGQPFSDKTWAEWTQAKQAVAVPGAVQFARYVNSHGGTMFYISNRDAKDSAATKANMEALGFPGVNDKTLLLKTDSSNKQARFDSVKASGYHVVLYVGDNLNDFGAATYHKDNAARRQFVSDNHARFGTELIVLPNPLYGDWESGMAPGYFKLTPEQKLQVRENNLRAWSGQ